MWRGFFLHYFFPFCFIRYKRSQSSLLLMEYNENTGLYFVKLLYLNGDFIFLFNELFSWINCYLFFILRLFPPLPLFTHLWGVGRKQSFSFTDMNQSISFCLIHLQGFLFVYLKSVWFICCIAHGIVGRCLSAAFTCLTPTVNCILYDHSAFPFSWITCCTVQNSAESQVNWRVTIMK